MCSISYLETVIFPLLVFWVCEVECNSTFLQMLWTLFPVSRKSWNHSGCAKQQELLYCLCENTKHCWSLFSIPPNAFLIRMTWYITSRFEKKHLLMWGIPCLCISFVWYSMPLILGRLAFENLIFLSSTTSLPSHRRQIVY